MNRLIRMAGLAPAILGILCACQSPGRQVGGATTAPMDLTAIYADVPFSMPTVERPSFPAYEVNICDFGAKSDGVTLNTEAINRAIQAVHAKGGGRVIIPEGLWLTGPITLLRSLSLAATRLYIPLSRLRLKD